MLVAHVGVAAFVVLGQLFILLGGVAGFDWVRNGIFRSIHLALIVFIAGQSLLGRVCPLTLLEHALRQRAGPGGMHETLAQHWLSPLLFFTAPPVVFIALHVLAALIIVGTWIAIPPDLSSRMLQFKRGADAVET